MSLRVWRSPIGTWTAFASYRGAKLVVVGRPTRFEASWHACAFAFHQGKP